ncbi:MAG: DMT family transporter [Nocardioides sp.]|nr:DMT family transporter [Nocardioides sp.]
MPDRVVSRSFQIAAIPLMLFAGALIPLQSQINGRLAGAIGTGPRAGIGAAVISFGSGLVVLLAVTTASSRERGRIGTLLSAVRTRKLRPVELIGGLFGAFLVASQGLAVAEIGVAVFSVAVTAGQACSALAVDHFGLGPTGRQAVSAPRAVAAVFAVVAVGLASWSQLVDAFSWTLAVLMLIPFLAGVGWSVQQALNGRVSAVADPWVTALNNFAVGTVALLVAFAFSFLAHGSLGTLPGTWWLYLGGVIGICFIWLAAWLVPVHGVLVLGLSMIAGQVIGAEIIQSVVDGAMPSASGLGAGAVTVLGVVIALVLRRR